MHRHIPWLPAAAATLFATTTAAAQEVQWSGTITPTEMEQLRGITDTAANIVPKDGGAVLTIRCIGGASCARVSAALVQTNNLTHTTQRKTVATRHPDVSTVVFEIPGADVLAVDGKTDLRIALATDTVGRFELVHATGTSQGNRAAEPATPTLAQLLARDCSAELRLPDGPFYNERMNAATFIVTPVGNVLRRPAPVIDETDSVTVVVLADERLIPLLKVYRKSEIRTVGEVRFIGEGTDLSKVFRPQSERVDSVRPAARPACHARAYVLRDFKHGKGEVEISALTGKTGDEDATEVVGGFDFNVNPLYSGAFSLGAMRTTLSAPEYGLTADGESNVVSIRENGDFRLKYVLMYTHFVWGKRDVEKLPGNPLHRLNPSMGVVIDDIPNNWIGAVTTDPFEGVYVSYGVHFGRVKRLDPESGLRIGDVFTGEEDDIPTRQRWIGKQFLSITVDVRAAAELLRMALTGAAGGS